jgi:hypothetical protein
VVDLIVLTTAVALFLIAAGYVRACARLVDRSDEMYGVLAAGEQRQEGTGLALFAALRDPLSRIFEQTSQPLGLRSEHPSTPLGVASASHPVRAEVVLCGSASRCGHVRVSRRWRNQVPRARSAIA